MGTFQQFQQNFARELTDPSGWDYVGTGAASAEEFFKNRSSTQALFRSSDSAMRPRTISDGHRVASKSAGRVPSALDGMPRIGLNACNAETQ
jgi:hypothetical protein